MTYGLKVAIAFDQLCNALCGGMPDETLSARAEREHREGLRSWPRKIVNAIFFWQEDHCRTSFESELVRRHLPEIYTNGEGIGCRTDSI